PLAAVQIPIVIPFLAHNLPLHAAHGDALAVAIERDHVKANDFALACPPVLERWPQAEIEVVQAHRHREALTHHTPAPIGDARDHARAQRPGSFWFFRQTERKLRGAAAIRHRSRQLEVALVKALIGYTEAIAFMFRERVRIDHQPAFRFHREAGTRRPVEEISLHIDRPRLPAAEHIFARFDLHAQPFGHEVFDRPAHRAGDRLLTIHDQLRPPNATRRRAIEIDVLRYGAGVFRFQQANATGLGAIRAIDDESRLPVRDCATDLVADEAHQTHALAWAVNAALRIEIRVNIAWRTAAIDAAIGELQ